MSSCFLTPSDTPSIPILFIREDEWDALRNTLPDNERTFATAHLWRAKPGDLLLLPNPDGTLARALFAIESNHAIFTDPFRPGSLAERLPKGIYHFANMPHDMRLAALAFALGTYRFSRYRDVKAREVQLMAPDSVDIVRIQTIADAVMQGRDLINTPANDMGPEELETAARELAETHGASIQVISGDDLLAKNFPLIHAVGKASSRAPRLIDMRWGNANHPCITLVGKGVCFDTGGLDLKPESAMLLMKKDMAGAATVLALGAMIMAARLNVHLRILIPAVENAVSGSAFRPQDIYPSRKGLSVEIGNTDAEGRLVLADALACADEEPIDLLIDLGTLTGAARVALGPDIPPFYTRDDELAATLLQHARSEHDPLWRMPLWHPYDANLDSKIADLNNIASGGFAGSIYCALFLQRFVKPDTRWLHVDIYGWNPTARAARPQGGEVQAARAIFATLLKRYA